jgi:hypothetical protein
LSSELSEAICSSSSFDQLEARVDVAPPRVGDRHPVEQLAAGEPEQIADRARMTERHQRRVDPVLQRRAVTHQMEPVARQLTLAPDRRLGQPNRRHEIAPRQLRQNARVDLVGLASQRREPLDLLRIGDQHFPAEFLERVVHEPRPGHRLDHRPHPHTPQPLGKMPQPVRVRRRRSVLDQLARVVDQAHIEPTST